MARRKLYLYYRTAGMLWYVKTALVRMNEVSTNWAEVRRRIIEKREAIGISQSQLARKLGLSPQAVSQWETGETETIGIDRLDAIAVILRTTTHYLLTGYEDPRTAGIGSGPQEVVEVPVRGWDTAGTSAPSHGETITTTEKVGKNAYALRVRGDFMEPKFADGSTIIVDPDEPARDGDFVVVRFDAIAEASMKQLVFDGPRRYLKTLNPRYGMMELDQSARIVGVVVEVRNRVLLRP